MNQNDEMPLTLIRMVKIRSTDPTSGRPGRGARGPSATAGGHVGGAAPSEVRLKVLRKLNTSYQMIQQLYSFIVM